MEIKLKRNEIILGIDVGGTNVKIGAVNSELKVIKEHRFPTKNQSRPLEMIGRWKKEINQFILKLAAKKIVSIGMGLPGCIDRQRNILIASPNLNNLVGNPVKKMFEQEFKVPVMIDNDVNAFTLGEYGLHWQYIHKNVLALALGTGVGGGIIIDKRIYSGNGNAGELGHICIKWDGPRCNCGSRGCLEQYASGNALIGYARERLYQDYFLTKKRFPEFWSGNYEKNKDWKNTTNDIHQNPLNPLHWKIDGKVLTKAANEKDTVALRSFKRIGFFLGIGCAALANAFDPELIIIGGGILPAKKFFLPDAKRSFQQRAIRGIGEKVKIVSAKSGNSAIVGCAMLCL